MGLRASPAAIRTAVIPGHMASSPVPPSLRLFNKHVYLSYLSVGPQRLGVGDSVWEVLNVFVFDAVSCASPASASHYTLHIPHNNSTRRHLQQNGF